ncbi:MAG: hypothetical protein GXN91_00310 [Epsilonproteobacteria bacterium]|nr:hypothetical protein [Campylobacterota bacterium]
MRYIFGLFALFFIGCTNSSQVQPTDSSLCNATLIEQPSNEELEKFNQKCEVPKWSE